MYTLLVFDLDGTLVDTVGDIADALNAALGSRIPDGDVARLVGGGSRELVRRAGGDDAAFERFVAAYGKKPVARSTPYLGVRETLARLPQEKAIATNKPGAIARTVVEKLGLADHFIAIFGEDDVGAKKPDPLMIDLARGKAGARKADTILIGDSLTDAATAQAAGVDLALVTWGYADPAAIRAHPARFHVERFADLAKLLQ
jgi:phosphoglycolate phosphatase